MSKILAAMQKAAPNIVDLSQRLQTIDRGNLYPLPEPDQAREFEQLANSLINMHDGRTGKVVVFSSTYAGEGSSYVSYNLARYLTLLLDRKVAWIDGNFRNPHQRLKNLELNFFDLLTDPMGLPELTSDPELVIVGNGKKAGKTMDLLKSQLYARFLEQMRENFYFTIIDAPPIMDTVETAHMAKAAMGLVLVVESQRLKREVIQHGIEKMRSQGVNILGSVLNKRPFYLPEFLYKRL